MIPYPHVIMPHFPTPLRSILLKACVALLLSAAPPLMSTASAAEGDFSEYIVMVPSRNFGGVEPAKATKPEVIKEDNGAIAAIRLPASESMSSTLVWWFAGHVSSRLVDWPRGSDASLRAIVKTTGESEIQVKVSLFTGNGWAHGNKPVTVKLPADQETAVFVPLPEDPPEDVRKVQLVISSKAPLPDLEITSLAVGTLSTP